MSDLLIRDIDPHLKSELEERARLHKRSLSEEARLLLKAAIAGQDDERGMFSKIRALLPAEYRSDDYVFELRGEVRDPPDFK